MEIRTRKGRVIRLSGQSRLYSNICGWGVCCGIVRRLRLCIGWLVQRDCGKCECVLVAAADGLWVVYVLVVAAEADWVWLTSHTLPSLALQNYSHGLNLIMQ